MPFLNSKPLNLSSPRTMNLIGKNGMKNLLCFSENMKIYQEHFFQNEVQQRFYRYTTDCYLFILDGQAFIQNGDQERSIKKHQGVWLKAGSNNKLVPISHRFECLIVTFQNSTAASTFTEFMQVQSTGTAEKSNSPPSNTRWILSSHPLVKIEIELIPKKCHGPLQYHRSTQKFLVSLTDTIQIIQTGKEHVLEAKSGLIFTPNSKHKIINNNEHSVQILNIYSPRVDRDKVLVINKTEH
mgnify:CR=1 FL=1